MRSAAGLFYAAVFAFVTLADAGHGTKTTDMANKCAVSLHWAWIRAWFSCSRILCLLD